MTAVPAVVALLGCTRIPAPPPASDPAPAEASVRRSFAPMRDGAPILEGISYGPFRAGQRPGGPGPSDSEILEDLQLIAPRWGMIRMYGSRGPTEAVLRTIRDEHLPIGVVVGAWIGPDDAAANAAEVEGAIRLAKAYPEQVLALSIGNESQVSWSGHRTPSEVLVGHLREARAAVSQPVTTADDYNFWNKPESDAIASEVDFLLLHAYAMWNKQTLDDAVPWTASTVASIRAAHPDLPIVIGETGWATELNPDLPEDSDQRRQIVAPAGEAEQARFVREFTAWAVAERLPHFLFEAFDEPWKGGDDPRDIEKHWGLYRVDRTPKERAP